MTVEVDRSRIVAFQRCNRERFLSYHLGGRGLQRKSKSLPLQLGSAFHEGIEEILNGHGVEAAVLRARLFLSNAFEQSAVGFDGEDAPDAKSALTYGAEEQAALAEALLRGWAVYEWEAFNQSFEVIETEQEGRVNLADDLVLMFRPDGIVRERESGDYYCLSWKTCSMFTKRTVNQARTDMQSMSEVFGIEQTKGIKIEGVLYRWVVKGRRSFDDYDSLWKQDSPLIYFWKRTGPAGCDDDDYAWKYSWQTEELNDKGKYKKTTLGKGWRKCSVWKEYPGGVKQWIADLAANQIAPRHISALEAVFPQALPVERRADEVESWKRQIVEQESNIAQRLEFIGTNPDADDLDRAFPQYSHSCEAYSGCSFREICWGGVAAEPGELYQIRQSNHPESGDQDE